METLEDAVLYHIPKTSSAPVVQLIHELQLQEDIQIETLSFDHVRTDVKYGALNPKQASRRSSYRRRVLHGVADH